MKRVRGVDPRWLLVVALSAFGFFGCETEDRLTYSNEGQVCVSWPTESEPLTLSVTPEDCPSCCGRLLEARCEVNVEGESIFVEAQTVYAEIHSRRPQPCCAACPNLSATCELPDLPDGDYTINVGNYAFPYSKESPALDPDCVGVAEREPDL